MCLCVHTRGHEQEKAEATRNGVELNRIEGSPFAQFAWSHIHMDGLGKKIDISIYSSNWSQLSVVLVVAANSATIVARKVSIFS